MKFNFDIIGFRRKFYVFSAILMIAGLGLLAFRGLNLGIDFRSGTIIELNLDTTAFELDLNDEFTASDVQRILAPYFGRVKLGEKAEGSTAIMVWVTEFDDANFTTAIDHLRDKWDDVVVSTPTREEITTGRVREIMAGYYNQLQVREIGTEGTSMEVRTTDFDDQQLPQVMSSLREIWPMAEAAIPVSVDATFSGELVRQAIVALVLASIGMLIYIAIRFEYKFAIAAVLAILHDVVLVLAFFTLFRIEVNSEFVAAILTIVGYSINDTIVVFDRIRENLRGSKRQADFAGIVNRSIMETLVRSINTSFTTLLAIGAVLFLGGVTLRPMALALVVGILAGTYSSIFVASSIWVDWKEYEAAKRLKKA